MSKLRPGGGYRNTASFQTATIIYDGTYWFCEKFMDSRSRTVDQMVQAARSGRQNIAEGCRFGATSSQTELRLINAARSSQEELLLDFEDYLRHRQLAQWAPDGPEAMAMRRVPYIALKDQSDRADPSDPSDRRMDQQPRKLTDLTNAERWELYAPWLEHDAPSVRANALICLIHQVNYLLDQQIEALEKRFVEDGGYSEQLATERLAERTRRKRSPKKDQSDRSDPTDTSDPIPECPQCGRAMVLRTAKGGRNPGSQFWGCSAYPECKGVINV